MQEPIQHSTSEDLDLRQDAKKGGRGFHRLIARASRFLRSHWYYIHVVLIAIFVLFALILGDSNLYQQVKLSKRIASLEKEIATAEALYQADKADLENRVKASPKDIEMLARKSYGFKEEGEMVFLLVDTLAKEARTDFSPKR